MFVRAEYNYDMKAESDKVGLDCESAIDGADGKLRVGDSAPSLAKQSFAEECDINTIVRRFGLTGQLPSDIRMPLNGDFQDVPDFRTAMDMLVAARESFDAMPADVRARFHNDAAEFVDFCSDDKNRDEAIKLGLVERKAVAVPAAAVAAPVAAPSTPST